MNRFLFALLLALGLSGPMVAQSTLPLVQQADLVYQGAFRLPLGTTEILSFNGGGRSIAYVPATDSLLIQGSASAPASYLADVTIPDVHTGSSLNDLARAAFRQPFTDVLRGHQFDIGSGGPIGGVLPLGNDLIVSAYVYYDANYVQTKSHFKTGLDFSNLPVVIGPVEIATGTTAGGRAGLVSGYMTPVPAEWQALLGGTALTGNCCIPIITRTNWGPGVSVFNPADIGVKDPVPATTLIRYTADHPTLGGCDSSYQLFNCGTEMGGVVFVPGTRSVLFFGRIGLGPFCYGISTGDPALHGQPVPGEPGVIYCYDLGPGGKGTHAYPYAHHVWAYDVLDLIAVKSGSKQPWEVVPSATWTFGLPFQTEGRQISGVAYDPGTHRIFLSMAEQDAPRPLIQVYTVLGGAAVAPPVPLSATVTGSGTVASTPSGLTCTTGTCQVNFASGAIVQLSATPANGWVFSGWAGACFGTAICRVSMTSAVSVTATFTPATQTDTLSATVTGSGTITSVPSGLTCTSGTCSASFASGTTVQLTATPASGWTFGRWGGACNDGAPCSVLMTSAKSVTATFTQAFPPVDCVVSTWSAWSAWSAINPTTEERTRTRTVVTPASNGGAACPALSETETRAIVVTLVATTTINKCVLTITDTPPDTTGGWKVQLYRNPGVSQGSSSTTIFTRSATVALGTYLPSSAWTKTGQTTVTRTAAPVVITTTTGCPR